MSGRAEWARRLMDEAVALRAPFGLERSCKIGPLLCNADRFIVSIHVDHLGADGGGAVAGLARRLLMPAPCLEHACALLACADVLHLGYEGEEGGPRLKLYLEFPAHSRGKRGEGPDEAGDAPVFTAWKWRPGEEDDVISHYLPLPCSGREDIAGGIASLCGAEAPALAAGAVRLADTALARTPAASLQLLAVEEPGTVRRSFDLNLYPAGLSLGASMPQLRDLAAAVGAPPGAVEAVAGGHPSAVLGHVAGGTTRDGRPFATFYFGAEGR